MPVMCGPMGLKHSQNALFRNNGDGTFSDVSTASGITKATGCYGFMPVTLDYDLDGWPDLFVSCDSTPNLLFRNNRNGTFTEIGMETGVALNEDGKEQASMGVAVGDYNLDGYLDLLVTNFSEDTPALYQNNRDGTLLDATYAAKLGLNTQFLSWGTAFVDLDLDGWKDLFIVSGHVYPEVDRPPLQRLTGKLAWSIAIWETERSRISQRHRVQELARRRPAGDLRLKTSMAMGLWKLSLRI